MQLKNMRFSIVFCDRCSMALRFPTLSSQALAEYYSNYNLSNYHNDLEVTFRSMLPISRLRQQAILRGRGEQPRTYLEIGPGAGTLMDLFKSDGAEVIGIEPDATAAAWLERQKGFTVINAFFEDFARSEAFDRYAGYFDVVVLSHVLEHVGHPTEFLHLIRKLVKPSSGVLYIEVPNLLKPYSDGPRWQDHCDPGHFYYYSPACLKYVVERSGFHSVSLDDDFFPPYCPISALFRPAGESGPAVTPVSNDRQQVKTIWRTFRLLHRLFYGPVRSIAGALRNFMKAK